MGVGQDDDEIADLIKREIAARNFFLLCESDNARKSKWVQGEIAHVKSLPRRRVEVIEIDVPGWEKNFDVVARLVRKATVFLSYQRRDAGQVLPVFNALVQNDFSVFDPVQDMSVGMDWQQQLTSHVEEVARCGFFLHFISQDSGDSWGQEQEVASFFSHQEGGIYIPVLLTPSGGHESGSRPSQQYKGFIYPYGQPEIVIELLLKAMEVSDTRLSRNHD